MNQIYDKINNHELLNYYDIAKFMRIHTKGKARTIFFKTEIDMAFSLCDKYLEVRLDYQKYKLQDFKKLYKDKLRLSDGSENTNFLVDIYNLNLLFELFHELEHYKQMILINKLQSFKTKLIRESINCAMSSDMYFENHDLYYFEYDATIKAFISTLDIIQNKCKNLNVDSIIEYNRLVSTIIYHSYGHAYNDDIRNESENYSKFTSPVSYSKFLCNNCYEGIDKKIFLLSVKDMERRLRSEYMRLINGFDISDKTEKLLWDFCMDNYSTVNILEDVKNKTKRKYKTK